ncbi:hypothetical protein R5W24_005696, partial [Gemmata sp. JC717]|uniref:hypothetical protein n=1 Tax=Gemmata algarum TaxID=2975278 RepID=UPI0021BB9D38
SAAEGRPMGGVAREKELGNRLGLFCVGGAVATLCGFLAWFSFALTTAMMNSALEGREYWTEVGNRFGRNLGLTVLTVLSSFGSAFGVVLMGRAII